MLPRPDLLRVLAPVPPKEVIEPMLAMGPPSTTLRNGVGILITTPVVARVSKLRAPFKVSVFKLVPMLLKIGVPAKLMALATVRLLLSTSREVPSAKDTVPTPRGPERSEFGAVDVLLVPRMIPPCCTARPPSKVLWPLSWSSPLSVLRIRVPVPVIAEEMFSEAASPV